MQPSNAPAKSIVELLESRCLLAAYPSGSGIINVTNAPYNAVPNDGIDDTVAIQAALTAYANGNRVIWLPNGTYDVSNKLSWSLGASGGGDDYKRTILEGESRDGVIIRLKDSTTGYQSTTSPKAVIFTGNGVAQRFRNAIRDLTVNTGVGNPGAIGIQFMANNQGCMQNVKIVSGDGQGVIGLDTTQTGENGPALIKGITVQGFQTGIKTRYSVDSLTFEDITLSGQTLYGFWNHGQQINIRHLNSTNSNTIPAVYQEINSSASMVLLDSTLTGTGTANPSSRAIWNQKALYARNLTTSGYAKAIDHDDKGYGNPDVIGPNVAEWHSHLTAPQSLNGSHTGSINLPVLETPTVPHDPFAQWASPTQFGAVQGDGGDDTTAIQQAIDSGATTIYFPGGGAFIMNGTVSVRGNVRRIIGLEGNVDGSGRFRVIDGANPTVVIERFDFGYQTISIENASARTLVIANTTMGGAYVDNGTGDLFLADVVGGNWVFNGGRVFARQLNPENAGTKVINNGAVLWILGLKTEKVGTKIETTNGGTTELMGAMIYTNDEGDIWPAFINNESNLSINGIVERCYNGDPLDVWVRETRNGVTSDFLPSDITDRGNLWYAGYLTDSTAPTVVATQYDFEHGKLVVQFSEDVLASLQVSDVKVQPRVGGSDILPVSFAYDGGTHTATFSFASRLPDANYQLLINAGTIEDAAHNPLAGDYLWQNDSFFVLAGDTNRDRQVTISDLGELASNWQATGATWSRGDFNFDGAVTIADLGDLASNWQATLAVAGPAMGPVVAEMPSLAKITAPTTTTPPAQPAAAKPTRTTRTAARPPSSQRESRLSRQRTRAIDVISDDSAPL